MDWRRFRRTLPPMGVVLALVFGSGAANAGDLYAGVYDHALFAPAASEHGEDAMLGYRTAPILGWTWLAKPSVHVMISGNSAVSTDFVAIGLNWRLPFALDGRLYWRPGVGLAYTNGEANVGNAYDPGLSDAERERRLHLSQTRIDFGSHAQFEPELALGYRLTPHWSVESSYVHLSNGQIFHQGKNQGLDDAGLRVAYSF